MRDWLQLGACAGALAYFFYGSPLGVGPICPFRWMIGLPCPLCGMTRALLALGHGDWISAFQLHPLSFAVMPFIALGALLALLRVLGFSVSGTWPIRATPAVVITFVAFGILRIALIKL